jgi:8-oxo-dGTP diphosphatase
MEVYAGRLKRHAEVRDEENHLEWMSVDQDYADRTRFAGVGNVGHMIYYIKEYLDIIEA